MWFALWVFFRRAKGLCWIGGFGPIVYISIHRDEVVNQFGHLLPQFELPIFGLFIGAGFAGFLELMARENAGYVRPNIGQLLPRRASKGSQ